MEDSRPLTPDFEIGIPLGLVLSLVTCGLYNVYWNYKQIEAMNVLLGRKEYDFTFWILLTLVTCGLYHVYYEYKMGSDLYQWLKSHGHDPNPNIPLIGLGLSCLGLWIVADAIYQHELNKLVSK